MHAAGVVGRGRRLRQGGGMIRACVPPYTFLTHHPPHTPPPPTLPRFGRGASPSLSVLSAEAAGGRCVKGLQEWWGRGWRVGRAGGAISACVPRYTSPTTPHTTPTLPLPRFGRRTSPSLSVISAEAAGGRCSSTSSWQVQLLSLLLRILLQSMRPYSSSKVSPHA